MTELLLILVALLLIVACGVFVAAEFAFITVNRTSVERLAAKGDHKAKGVSHALKTLSTQLSGAQVGITITNLAIGFLAEPAISALIEPPLHAAGIPGSIVPGIALIVSVTAATVVTMLFGELVPKNIALARPMATARFVQGMQRGFSQIVKEPIKFLNGSANFALTRMGITPQEELASARSADELSSLVRRSAEKGTLPEETARMLERSLVFDELTALDVMTPRVKMHTVRANEPIARVLSLAKETGLSRFPVVGKHLDDIVGIVHIKHAFGVLADKRTELNVEQIMQPPAVTPSSISLDTLLEELRKPGLQMVVVIDEFGGTDGLVTIEDLLEELVGEVSDEHDHSASAIRKHSEGEWTISGLLRPDEIGEELGIFLPDEEEVETVGGLLTHRLERVPVVGDGVEVTALDRSGDRLTVHLEAAAMDGRRVDTLQMTVFERSNSEGSGS